MPEMSQHCSSSGSPGAVTCPGLVAWQVSPWWLQPLWAVPGRHRTAPLGRAASPLPRGVALSSFSVGSCCPQGGRAVPVARPGFVLAVSVSPVTVWQPGAEAGAGRAHPWARAVAGPADVRLQGHPEGPGVHPPRPAGNCKFQF